MTVEERIEQSKKIVKETQQIILESKMLLNKSTQMLPTVLKQKK